MSEEPNTANTATAHRAASWLSRLPIVAAVEVVIMGHDVTPVALRVEGLPATFESALDRIGPLPVAPQRWLWLGMDVDEAAKAVGDGAHVVDVEGKWAIYTCGGPSARRVLASVVDVDVVLAPRACTALTLFDCPAVLLRAGGDQYIVGVHSSYAASLEAGFTAALNAASPVVRSGDSNDGARLSDNGGRTG